MMSLRMNQKTLLVYALTILTAVLILGKNAYASSLPIPPDPGGNGLGSAAPAIGSARNYVGNTSVSTNATPVSAGTSVTPYYDVGNNSDFTYSFTLTRVYVQTGNSVTITIQNAGTACYTASGGGVVGPDYTSNGAPPTVIYSIIGAGGVLASYTHTGGCFDYTFGAVSTNSAYSITQTPDFNGYLEVEAQIPSTSVGQGEDSYQIAITSGSYFGDVGSGSTVFGLGYRDGDLNDFATGTANLWAGWTSFAMPFSCSSLYTPISSSASVQYKDSDSNNLGWNTNMIYVLQQQLINPDNTVGAWTNVQTQQGSGITTGTGAFNFTAYSNYRYRLVLANVGVRNTIRVIIPSTLSTLYSKLAERPSSLTCPLTGFSFSCTTNPASLTGLALNQQVNINVTAKNTGTAGWNPNFSPTIAMDKFSNGVNQGSITLAKSSTGGSTVNPGGSTTFGFTAYAPSTGLTTKTLTFTMYVGSSPMQGSSCTTTLTTGAGTSNPYGVMTLDCSSTNVTFYKTSAADYYYTPASPGYWVALATDAPYGKSPDGNWYWLGPSAPPAASPQPTAGGGAGATYTDAAGTIYDWYGELYYTDTPAVVIPYYIEFDNAATNASAGNSPIEKINGSSGSDTQDTFRTMGTFLWPHNSYTAKLFGLVTGSFDKNGPYPSPGSSAWTQIGPSVPLLDSLDNGSNTCLHADVSTACNGGPSTDGGPVEPGQNYTFSYGLTLTNDTNKTFSMSDPNGYNFQVWTSGGLVYLGGQPGSATQLGGPGTSGVTVTIPARVDYTGYFGVTFRFQGSQLAVDSWSGSCGVPGGPGTTGTDTPATRPYFQVWNADTKAGGGFRSPSLLGSPGTGSCSGSSDPPYITPVTSGNSYVGGIRAFGNQSGNLGSRTDFGALALGLIQGSPGGPVGFYSGVNHSAMFANSGSGLGGDPPGGYLNSNSDEHCVDDFFTDTRITPNPPAFSGDLTNSPSGQYIIGSGPGSTSYINGGSIPAGKQITVYVDGDLVITGNINYAGTFNPNNTTSIPYLAIIARGNITLTGAVGHLDGLYVAQPSSSSEGFFSTCAGTCNSQLVINGAVIAQHVELLRSHGTLGPLQDNSYSAGTNPSEIINYVPSMVIGSPMFSSHFGTLEGLFSLPPVF